MLSFLLLATFSQAQPACVDYVIFNLTVLFPNALTDLPACFQNTTYYYHPVSCALQNSIPDYCSMDYCPKLMQAAIGLAVQNNCTAEVLATLASQSAAICEPFAYPNAKACASGFACVNLTSYGEGFACLPMIPFAVQNMTNVTCDYTNIGTPCTPCNMMASAICNVDVYDVPTPVCVQNVFSTVNIFVDNLIDAYFYLYQTICQMSNGAFCVDLVYMNPTPTCTDAGTWGCCAGSYFDLAQNCENPVKTTINALQASCSTLDWTSKCSGGLSAINCCGKDTLCMSAAFGVAPSALVLALLALFALL